MDKRRASDPLGTVVTAAAWVLGVKPGLLSVKPGFQPLGRYFS